MTLKKSSTFQVQHLPSVTSDNEKTPGESGAAATDAAWTDTERMAYLIVIAEHALDDPIESKISQAPVPGGRNVNACRKIIRKLKDKLKVKLKDDIDNVKAGRPIVALAEGETAAPKKRKTESPEGGDASPKKKRGAVVKDEDESAVKNEEAGGEV
ncbi:hypothetical protein N0V91_000916 [Didymella pomorum]|uniref:Uncharacterized protein n=1 Tax=Didymella pomorum TaxID=749634 RepID=A0A9W9DAR2_9PLEO|nr:hypothetical protein N0V91_000916 [Didymella pomorum]